MRRLDTPLALCALTSLLFSACSSNGSSGDSQAEREVAEDLLVAAQAEEAEPAPDPGRVAPGFSLPDLDGKIYDLTDYAGRTVVLEWFNPQCPFVVAQHEDGSLAELPAAWREKGAVWFAINSNAAGKQGSDPALNQKSAEEWGMDYPILLDATGEVGEAYGALRTPHLFVIGPNGHILFSGPPDNAPFGKVRGGGPVVDYLSRALTKIALGQPIKPVVLEPYGCSIKYVR